MFRSRTRARNPRKLVVGVTVGASAQLLMRGQLRWLVERGWDVTLVSSPDERASATSEREYVALHEIPMTRGISMVADFRALIKWFLFLRSHRPTAVNVGTPKAGLLGGLAAWATRVPRRIYVVRGLRLEGASGPIALVLWMMERLSIAVATDVVVVSESLGKELLARRLTRPSKTWLIGAGSSNGVDSEAISRRILEVDRDSLRASMGFDKESVVVGYIGRLARDKGVDTLLKSLEYLDAHSSIKLLIVGRAEEGFDAGIFARHQDRIHWIDGSTDVPGLLPAIDILALPTHREGFPNVVLEAAAAAIPVITTRATGAIDSVVEGETGLLFDVDDEIALAEHILSLASSPATRQKMGVAAHERVVTQYSPNRIWRGLEMVLNGDPGPDIRSLVDIEI